VPGNCDGNVLWLCQCWGGEAAEQVSYNADINSDTMDVDKGGRHSLIKCYNCRKLGHIVKFCGTKRQIHGGNVGDDRKKDFVEEPQ